MAEVAYGAVVIGIVTFRRVEQLRRTIPEVLAQLASIGNAGTVLIVDNDPAGTAHSVVAELNDPRIRYVVEPQPGIAAARNRALDEAEGAQLLVFIDDDEHPVAGWLPSLVERYRDTRPTAVAGRVRSEFEDEPEPWILAGGFFERRSLPSGTTVVAAASNNLLLDLSQVRQLELRFDEKFGLSGGSDTLFTRQLTQRGGTIVWCDEAAVIDRVPAARMTRRWVLLRAMRYGNSWSRTSMALAGPGRRRSMVVRLQLAGAGAARLAGGGARWCAGAVGRSRRLRAGGVRTMAKGAGYLAGCVGYVYVEYARPERARRRARLPGHSGL